jgi:hypothetical protein
MAGKQVELVQVLLRLLWMYKVQAIALSTLLLLAVVFANIFVPALMLLVLGIIASFSTSYKRVIRIPPAAELVTFTTVIVGITFGPLVGAIFGALVTLIAEIMTNALDAFIVSFVPARAIIGMVAGLIFVQFEGNIIATGIVCSLVYNLLAQPLYLMAADVEMRMKSAFFMVLNIGSNAAIFAVLGPLAVRFLGL